MANQTVSTDQNFTAVISSGLAAGEDTTINSGAVLTIDSSPSILLGDINISEGELIIDGASAIDPIIFVGLNAHEIDNRGAGTFTTTLGWWEFPTTGDGTSGQTFDVSTYFTDGIIDADVFSGVWVETGRRLNYDGGVGVAPKVGDWVFKSSDNDIHGRIESVSGDGVTGYLVVRFLTGQLLDDENFEIHSLVDNGGPDYQKSWFGVMSADDVLEAGVYQEFGNCYQNNVNYLTSCGSGMAGFVFAQAWKSNTLTFGDGTNGFIIPDGAHIRVPMVHFATATTSTITTNEPTWEAATSNRYNLEVSQGGNTYLNGVSLGSVMFEDTLGSDFEATYVACNTAFGNYSTTTRAIYSHCIFSGDLYANSRGNARIFPALNSMPSGALVTDCLGCTMVYVSGMSGYGGATACNGVKYERFIQISLNSSNLDTEFNGCVGVELDDYVQLGGRFQFVSTSEVSMSLIKTQTNILGGQDTSLATNCFNFTTYSKNFRIKGWEILQNSGPNAAKVRITACKDIHISGFHFPDDKYDNDIGGVVQGEEFARLTGLCDGIEFSRIWSKAGNPSYFIIQDSGTTRGTVLRNCSADYVSEVEPNGINTQIKGLHAGSGNFGTTTGLETDYTGTTGAHFGDIFRSDTTGAFYYRNVPASDEYPVSIIAGAPIFTKDGDVDVKIGDQWEVDSLYYTKGHIAFTGVITTARNTSNVSDGSDLWTAVDIDFQYDTGTGYNGVWLDARTPANLTGIPDFRTGIRIKLRFTATANMTNGQGIMLHTTTTIAAQTSNLYPIDQLEATLRLSGLKNDTEVRVYRASDNVELAGQESVTTGEFEYTYTYAGVDIPIIIVTHALGFINQRITGLSLTDATATIPIQQSVDRQYENV